MFIVISEYIHKLSRKYDIIAAFNTKEEAEFLADMRLQAEGEYQHSCGYFYDCFVEFIDSNVKVMPNTRLYIIIKSGIYTGGVTRQTISACCSTVRADFECIMGVWETEEEMKENYHLLLQNDKDGFYFCFEYVKDDYCEQTNYPC